MMMSDLILGILLLFLGRKLFWVTVGIVGFLAGMHAAVQAMPGSSELMVLAAAVVLGIIGALLAVVFEWTAIVMMGFLGGGYLLANLLNTAAATSQYYWGIFVVGGVIGLIVMILAFDWALIIISSLIGSLLIVHTLTVDDSTRAIVFVCGVLVGILVQCLTLDPAQKKRR